MPLPLISIIPALAAGSSLVPHAAGGQIVNSAAGYVAKHYLSTAAFTGLSVNGVSALGVVVALGAATNVIGGAGILGTTIGATGITGALMSACLIASNPVWIPAAIGGTS